ASVAPTAILLRRCFTVPPFRPCGWRVPRDALSGGTPRRADCSRARTPFGRMEEPRALRVKPLSAVGVDDCDRFDRAGARGLEQQLVGRGTDHARVVVESERLGSGLHAVALRDAAALVDLDLVGH